MKKAVTLRAGLSIGTDDAEAAAQAQRRLEAAFKEVASGLKMRVVGWEMSGGLLALKLYIEGHQAAPLDFVATASEALRAALEAVQPSAGAGYSGPETARSLGPAIEPIENEDEDKGVYAPKPASRPRAPKAIPSDKKDTPRRRKKKLSGSTRPVPPPSTFHDCPLSGSGGDRPLNEMKNRTDVAPHWRDTSIQSLIELDWPQTINEKGRFDWSSSDMEAIKRNEGLPIRIKGWLAGAKKEGEESCNCNSQRDVDYHLWIVADKSQADLAHRSESVVCEVTPRVRAQHTGWDIKHIGRIVQTLTKVRLSGWLMMDQHHPEQLGRYRATLWEIHPIIEFEVQRDGKWVKLDDDEE